MPPLSESLWALPAGRVNTPVAKLNERQKCLKDEDEPAAGAIVRCARANVAMLRILGRVCPPGTPAISRNKRRHLDRSLSTGLSTTTAEGWNAVSNFRRKFACPRVTSERPFACPYIRLREGEEVRVQRDSCDRSISRHVIDCGGSSFDRPSENRAGFRRSEISPSALFFTGTLAYLLRNFCSA